MKLREMEPGDFGYILSSFISSFRQASTHADGLRGRQITGMLSNLIAQDWTVTVAEEAGLIAGWVLHKPGQYLGWVYTRSLFRRQGLAKLLLKSVGIDLGRPVTTPFVPNRKKDACPLRLRLHHRPFLVLPADVQH